MTSQELLLQEREKLDHKNEDRFTFKTEKGITRAVVEEISAQKNEPEWMLAKRLHAFEIFEKLPMPTWGPDISKLDLNEITYFMRPDAKKNSKDWKDVPDDIKNTFDRLGIPAAEQKYLSGVGAQYESEVVYHSLKKELSEQGVIFEDCDIGVQEYPELMQKYFMKCVPVNLHKFAALHAAVWSGGTFLYVPPGVKIEQPLQAYFRMNYETAGQFEHTMIMVDKGAQVHYIEGCSAPKYQSSSLHAGCVEVFVHDGARARYSSVENWSLNTYNLNTKRAVVDKKGTMEWVGGNLGSGCTMLYPCSILRGEGARADHIGIAFATKDQNQDVGAKIYHLAKNTRSVVKSKSISANGGITTYRGLIKIGKGAKGSKSNVQCDAMMMDADSISDTVPNIEIQEKEVDVGHEASVARISEEQLFYIMSRGISEEDARKMIVAGFIEPIVRELPLEYAVEMNRLVEMEIEDSLG